MRSLTVDGFRRSMWGLFFGAMLLVIGGAWCFLDRVALYEVTETARLEEEVAVQLGLEAELLMVPADHLLLLETRALPAMVVVRLPNGVTHFVVVWRRHGRFVQVMDPATGRRWITCERFLNELYVHAFPVPAADWREGAGSDEFLGGLRRRLANLGVSKSTSARLVDAAIGDDGWRSLVTLDAAVRLVNAIVRSGGLRRGRQAGRVLESLKARNAKLWANTRLSRISIGRFDQLPHLHI
jgi:ATP-binding cassette subfamily B protein